MVQHKSNRENFNLQGSQSTDAVAFRPIRPHQCGYREINFVVTTGIEPGTFRSPSRLRDLISKTQRKKRGLRFFETF